MTGEHKQFIPEGAEDPEVFIDLADLHPPLTGDEPTPPMGKKAVNTQQVEVLNLAAIQARMAKDARKTADIRRESVERERVQTQYDDIYDAVENQDEDLIKGLLIREFGNVEFKNLDDLQNQLDVFFSGGREHSVFMDLNDLMKNPPQRKEMIVEFRPRVGGKPQFVEFTLVNESDLGKGKDKTITHVTDVNIKRQDTTPAQPPKKVSLYNRLFGKK